MAENPLDAVERLKRELAEARDRLDQVSARSERDRMMFEKCPLGIVRTSPGGLLLEGNPALMRMFGYDDSLDRALLERDLADLIYADPARRAEVVGQILASDEPVRVEILYRRRDGSLLVGVLHAWAVRDDTGMVKYVEGLVEDISERKMAEEGLRAGEELLRVFFHNALEGISLLDDVGHTLDANPATLAMTGYSLEELKTMTVTDLAPEERKAEVPELISLLMENGRVEGEFSLVRKDGVEIQVDYVVVANLKPGQHACFWKEKPLP